MQVELIEGSGHGDIEGPSQAIYRWACGDDGEQSARDRVMDAVMSQVRAGLGRAATPDR